MAKEKDEWKRRLKKMTKHVIAFRKLAEKQPASVMRELDTMERVVDRLGKVSLG